MFKNISTYMAFALTTVLAVSCVEDYSPGKKDIDAPRLVVESVITTDTTAHAVKLSATAPYGAVSSEIEPVSGAVVTLSDGIQRLTLTEDGNTGIYLTPDTFYGEVGRTYTLDIEAEIDGKRESYHAQDVIPEAGIRADAFDYYKLLDSLWVFAIWGQDLPGIKSNYAADLVVNGQRNPFGSWVFINGLDVFDGNYLNCGEYLFYYAHEGTSDADPTKPGLKEGDVVELYFYTVSDFFFNFLLALTNESMPHFPLFSPQPANLPTNISGGAAGCFCSACLTKLELVIGDPDRTKLKMMMDHRN